MSQQPATEQVCREETSMAPAFVEHAFSPQNLGVLPPPAVAGTGRGTCGDSIELYLRVEDERVCATRFMPQGCVHTVACGSALTSLISGQPLDAAAQIGAVQVEEALGGLTREHRHCAVVAVTALKSALRHYYEDRNCSWKRLYQRS